MTAAHPRTTFQCECPRVFTSIYLKLLTSYYAHILLIAMLYFDRIIQGLKLTKQKYVYMWAGPTTAPFLSFCARFLMLPFLLNLSFFIKHDEILSWPPTCPAMYEVMRSFGVIKTKTHYSLRLAQGFACAHFLVREYAK